MRPHKVVREVAMTQIYHNPRCSKSRQTLDLLRGREIEPQVIEYLKTPPTAEELKRIMEMLDISDPRSLMRMKESEYKEAGLDDPDLSREQLIEAMVRYPRLIERPIVVHNGRAAIGRPPEDVLEIL
jgi:arsenate reductase